MHQTLGYAATSLFRIIAIILLTTNLAKLTYVLWTGNPAHSATPIINHNNASVSHDCFRI